MWWFDRLTYWKMVIIEGQLTPPSFNIITIYFLWWEYLKFTLLTAFKYVVQCCYLKSLCCTLAPKKLFILQLKVCSLGQTAPHFSHSHPLETTILLLVHLFLIPHINDIIQYFSFSVWLTSPNNAFRAIHVVTSGRISFFFYG